MRTAGKELGPESHGRHIYGMFISGLLPYLINTRKYRAYIIIWGRNIGAMAAQIQVGGWANFRMEEVAHRISAMVSLIMVADGANFRIEKIALIRSIKPILHHALGLRFGRFVSKNARKS